MALKSALIGMAQTTLGLIELKEYDKQMSDDKPAVTGSSENDPQAHQPIETPMTESAANRPVVSDEPTKTLRFPRKQPKKLSREVEALNWMRRAAKTLERELERPRERERLPIRFEELSIRLWVARAALLKLRKDSPLLLGNAPCEIEARELRVLFSEIIEATDERRREAADGATEKWAVWREGGRDIIISRLRSFAEQREANPPDAEASFGVAPTTTMIMNAALTSVARNLLCLVETIELGISCPRGAGSTLAGVHRGASCRSTRSSILLDPPFYLNRGNLDTNGIQAGYAPNFIADAIV